MEMKEYDSEVDMLCDILRDIAEMIIASSQDKQELIEREAQLQSDLTCQKLTKLASDIEIEQLRRSHRVIDGNLRNLEHQRNFTIKTINQLGKIK